MPRGPRAVPECGIFHITMRGNNKRCVFRRDGDYIRFESLLDRYKKKLDFYLMRQVLTLNSLNNQAIYEKCRKILLLTSNNHYKM